MEWGIRVSALPEKAGGSAGNGQQQKVTEGSHQKLSTLGKTYVALQETASPFKSNVGEVQHLLTSEQNYPRKAPSLGMMRDIFVIHDESMLPVKRPQDAGKGLPGAMFFLQHMPHAGPPVREDFMPTDKAPPIAHAAHDIIALNHPLLTPFFHQ